MVESNRQEDAGEAEEIGLSSIQGASGPLKGSTFEGVTTAEGLANEAIQQAEGTFIKDGAVPAHAIFVVDDSLHIFELAPFMQKEETKVLASALLHAIIDSLQPQGLVYISEIWLAEAKNDEELTAPVAVREDKREGLLVTAAWKGGEQAARITFVERAPSGKVAGLARDDNFAKECHGHGLFAFSLE